jgi:hypothetical protein
MVILWSYENHISEGSWMKFAILFIFGVIVAAAVGAGVVHMLQPVAEEVDYNEKIAANESSIAGIRSAIEKSNNDMAVKMDSLSGDMLALSERIEGLEKELRVLEKTRVAQAGAPEKGMGAEAVPTEIEALVDKIVKEKQEERQKERQEQRTEHMAGMQNMIQGMINTRLNEFAKEKNWNIAKQEEVKRIIDSSMKKMTELFKEFRMDGPPSPETIEKIQEIMQETEAKLKEVMTEEEWKEFQESMPRPGMFGPGRMRPRGQDQGGEQGR